MTVKNAPTFNPAVRYVYAARPAVCYVPEKYDPKTDPDLQRCACTDPNACYHT